MFLSTSCKIAAGAAAVMLTGCATRVDYDPAREGLYLGAGGLYAFENFDMDDLESQLGGTSLDVDDSVGATGKVGYRMHPNFAVEGDFQWLDEFQFEQSNGSDIGDIDGWGATANLKGYFATGPFQPFAFAGIGLLELEFEDDVGAGVDEDETDVLTRFGAGFDVYLTETIALFAEAAYNLPLDDLDDFDFVTVAAGLLFRF